MDDQNILVKEWLSSWSPAFRWAALLPAALLVFFLGMTLGKYFVIISLAFGGAELFGEGVTSILTTVLTEVIGISALVIISHDMAPKFKKEIALALCAIFGIISIYGFALITFLWENVSTGDKLSSIVTFLTALVVVIWMAIYIVKRNKKAYPFG